MELSFVIPAYNEEKVLAKCLASVVEQVREIGDRKIEIIVVNNASTDRTKEIAASFPEVLVVDESRKGLVRARRAGFEASKGALIANIDADTVLTPGWLKKVFEEFSGDEGLVALSGPFIYYDLRPAHRAMVRVFYGFGYLSHLFNQFVLKKGSMLQGGNFILRRFALERIGGYDTENFEFYGEDTDLARRLPAVGTVKYTFSLPMYASGRRLAEEGIIRMGLKYGINYFWTIVFKKPFTKKYKDVGR